MSAQGLSLDFPGQVGLVPRFGHLNAVNNTLAQVATAGFLTNFLLQNGLSLLSTDIIGACCSDGNQWYKPVIAAGTGVVTLTVLP